MRALTLIVAACALLAVGCGSGTGEEDAASATAPTTSSDPSSRPPAPAIEGMSLEGERLALADFRGRPVLVNVWSSW